MAITKKRPLVKVNGFTFFNGTLFMPGLYPLKLCPSRFNGFEFTIYKWFRKQSCFFYRL